VPAPAGRGTGRALPGIGGGTTRHPPGPRCQAGRAPRRPHAGLPGKYTLTIPHRHPCRNSSFRLPCLAL
jgi:hypothetical protein